MSNDPERMVTNALRAEAGMSRPANRGPMPRPFPIAWVLLISLLLGAIIGVSVALISILEPGLLPVIG